VAVENRAERNNRWRALKITHHVGKDSAARPGELCARLFLGKIVKCSQRGFFMESSAGVCDVYIPTKLCRGSEQGSRCLSLCVGETAAVEAVLCRVGRNNWRARRVVY
jgi:hypothetical protein